MPSMAEKRYRVEPETDCDETPTGAFVIVDCIGNCLVVDTSYTDEDYAEEDCELFNTIYQHGLAVNEKYRLAWEELRQLQRQIGSRAANILSLDDIAARHGIREE